MEELHGLKDLVTSVFDEVFRVIGVKRDQKVCKISGHFLTDDPESFLKVEDFHKILHVYALAQSHHGDLIMKQIYFLLIAGFLEYQS